MYNLIVLGHGKIAALCMGWLANARYQRQFRVCSLVTSLQEYKEWSPRFSSCPIYVSNRSANEHKILKIIKAKNINLLLSIQHRWILSPRILYSVEFFAFNLHNAKLPEYKGYNCISHAILNGESEYRTTIHWMVPEVDSGELAYEESLPISKTDTAQSLYQRTVEASLKNFKKLIRTLARGYPIPRRKMNGKSHFFKKSDLSALKRIRSLDDSREVDRKARACYMPPYEPAYFEKAGKRFYVIPAG